MRQPLICNKKKRFSKILSNKFAYQMKKPLGDELAGNTTKIEISGSDTSASIWFGKV
jgi:hypothetical protein